MFGFQIVLLTVALIFSIIYPWTTVRSVALVFSLLLIFQGVFGLIDGIVNLGTYGDYFWKIIYGISSLGLGFGIIYFPLDSITVLGYLLDGWVLTSGFLNIIEGLILRNKIATELFLIVSGVVSVLLSILIFFFPAQSAAGFMWFVAIYLVLWIVFQWSQDERIRRTSSK